VAANVPPEDYVFFCDEAGISTDRFTAVGGFCVHNSNIPQILKNLSAYREQHNMKAELKWTKVSNQKEGQYTALVDYFFAMNNTNKVHFHCVIFDNHKWNHGRYNGGDNDVGLSKLYYQLIHHRFARTYSKLGSLHVCCDHRNSSTSLNDLRDMLNAAAARDHGVATRPFKQVVSADSKGHDMLQINDVILGAVCAARNGKHLLAATRTSKRNLAGLVLQKSGLETFERNSPAGVQRFTVWNFRARE
jgi:hypothetical protein